MWDNVLLGKIWTSPSIQLFLHSTTIAVGIAFVPPIPTMRLSAFGCVLACAVFGLLHSDRSQGSVHWNEFCVECTCGGIIYANYWLVLMKASPPPAFSLAKRLMWAIDMVLNPRGIGTTWQVRNLPPFSRKDPTRVPSRRSFIIQRIATGLLFFLLMKAFKVINENTYIANLQDGDYSEYKESIIRRMGDVSMRELFIRAWLPLQTIFRVWTRNQYLHSLVSVFAVVFGDKPRRWPPLYGDIREAYSLRRFWASFWQQLLRNAFVANASFIAQTLLLIPKTSPIYRGVITILVFCLTASLHAVGTRAVGPTCDITPVLRWYMLMGVAIIFEDLVKRMFWCIRSGEQAVDRGTSKWWRVFGYVWVWAYLGWSLPKLIFPMVDCKFGYRERENS